MKYKHFEATITSHCTALDSLCESSAGVAGMDRIDEIHTKHHPKSGYTLASNRRDSPNIYLRRHEVSFCLVSTGNLRRTEAENALPTI
jgi:hypothetical protein